MLYNFKELSAIVSKIKTQIPFPNLKIRFVSYDSRNVIDYSHTLFVAIKTNKRDGHDFIKDLVAKGVKNFIVEKHFDSTQWKQCNFISTSNAVTTLQEIASHHRQKHNLKVLGITGSNGKTIIKEWLSILLADKFNIVKTPQSFNSQIGVPISILNIDKQHNLGIFEAGISEKNEMQKLEKIIQPEVGIFTNLGTAHDENFFSSKNKLHEKLSLFKNSKILICFSREAKQIKTNLVNPNLKILEIGTQPHSTFKIEQQQQTQQQTFINLQYQQKTYSFHTSFTDNSSVENLILCACVLIHFGIYDLQNRLSWLNNLPMRLEISKGNHDCLLINDSYSNDITSFKVAIEFLKNRNELKSKSIIVSDLSYAKSSKDYRDMIQLINQVSPFRVIAVGEKLRQNKKHFSSKIKHLHFFNQQQECIQELKNIHFNKELILFKGARKFQFENILHHFKFNTHETILEVNFKNLIFNLDFFSKKLKPATKIMAVVKAFGYGAGSVQLAQVLQNQKIDYLVVAYIDEAIELRNNNITMPIMVMNTNPKDFPHLLKHKVEPEIYSIEILNQFINYLQQKNIFRFPIHLKIDTGMHRLGFANNDIPQLITTLQNQSSYLDIKSIFTHLASSDNPAHNTFSKQQFQIFLQIKQQLQNILPYKFLSHVCNSGGISQHPNMQMDMVRLGIGLYGISNNANHKKKLRNVLTLKTSIAQIKNLSKGDTVGYNRAGIITKPSKIATIRTGYAEGYPRLLGNGNAKVAINNTLVPTIGDICMDMMMIDISNLKNTNIGDTVILFGENPSLQTVAQQAQTIPYEIMTGISTRVRREYIYH